MNVLDEIINGVREDLNSRRIAMNQLLNLVSIAPAVLIPKFSKHQLSVIAEIKRSSPSKGKLADIADPADLARQYEKSGASAISVLTEGRKFNGSISDLDRVRAEVSVPILRKDFMIDEYQFYEARAHGADLVLLIVAALSNSQLQDYFDLSKELGMNAIIEVHDLDELERAMEIKPKIVGVNSRNLKTLEVFRETFVDILPKIPDEIIKVAESGIMNKNDVEFTRKHGADVILVGEALVKSGGDIPTLIGL